MQIYVKPNRASGKVYVQLALVRFTATRTRLLAGPALARMSLQSKRCGVEKCQELVFSRSQAYVHLSGALYAGPLITALRAPPALVLSAVSATIYVLPAATDLVHTRRRP